MWVVVIVLEQGGATVKAYLSQMDENDRDAFIEAFARHEKEDEWPFSLDLQLNVIHTSRRLKRAMILGEGEPRAGKDCKKLSEILPQ